MATPPPARAAGTFAISGELQVHRLGFGAMRLPGAHGEPRPGAARELLREAIRLGVDLIDTAHAYGSSQDLIADALHPYPEGLVIATKGGSAAAAIPTGAPSGCAPTARAACAGSASKRSTSGNCTGSIPRSRSRSNAAPSAGCRTRGRSASSGCRR